MGLLLATNVIESWHGTLLGLLIPTVARDFGVSTEVAAWVSIGSSFTSAM